MKRFFAVAFAVLACMPASLAAQAPERAVFVTMLGTDTLAVESSAIGAGSAQATLWLRSPIIRYQRSLALGSDVSLKEMTLVAAFGPRADSLVRRMTLTVTGDSGRVHSDDGTENATGPDLLGTVTRGAVPFLNLSGQSLELILRRARAIGSDSAVVPLLISGLQRLDARVTALGRDSALISLGGVVLRIRTDSVGRMLGGSVPSQRVTIVRAAADAPAASWRPVRVSYAAPAGAPYTAEDVSVRSPQGITLAGTLTMPAHRAGARVPAVVLITGSGSQDRDESTPLISGYRPFREIADTLSRRGIAVLRLDDRGVGGSDAGPLTATTADFADDIRAAISWLRARTDIDAARVGLVGHSEGGIIAPMIGATDRRLKALALIAGSASRGRDIIAYQNRYVLWRDSSIAPAARDSVLAARLRAVDSVLAVPGWAHFFGAYDPLPAARAVRAPVLILQGETDSQVVPAEARKLAAAMRGAGNRRVTLRTFPHMNHLMLDDASGDSRGYATLPSKQVRRDLLGALAEWLARTL